MNKSGSVDTNLEADLLRFTGRGRKAHGKAVREGREVVGSDCDESLLLLVVVGGATGGSGRGGRPNE